MFLVALIAVFVIFLVVAAAAVAFVHHPRANARLKSSLFGSNEMTESNNNSNNKA